MKHSDAIEMGIEKKDIPALRAAIGSICYTNRNFSNGEFDAAVQYVESKGIKLKDDALLGKPTISSQKKESNFTDEDFAMAVFELKRNFCDERIADVKRIGKALYPILDTKDAGKASGEERKNLQSHHKMKVVGIISLVALIIVVLILLIKK